MPDLPLPSYELSTTDLMLVQELIQWALQWKRMGIELPDARKRRLAELVDEIDRIVVARAASGDIVSMPVANEVLQRKPAGSESHQIKKDRTYGSK